MVACTWVDGARLERLALANPKDIVPPLGQLEVAQEELDDAFGREAHQAETEAQQQYKGAEPAGFGFARKLHDDEQHERTDAHRQSELGHLFFAEAEHGVSQDACLPGSSTPTKPRYACQLA